MSRSITALLISLATVSGRLIASIDQGTTSTRVILFDEKAKNVASHQMEHEQIYPKDGWCEHDPMTIVENTKTCLDKAVEKLEESGGKEEDVVGRSTGPGVWADNDADAYGEEGGEKRARVE